MVEPLAWGWVAGRLIGSPGVAGAVTPLVGVKVTFTPPLPRPVGPPLATIPPGPWVYVTDAAGYLVDDAGASPVQLAVGRYRVSYSTWGLPAHDIELTAAHTQADPLDLTVAMPPGGPVLTPSEFAALSARIDGLGGGLPAPHGSAGVWHAREDGAGAVSWEWNNASGEYSHAEGCDTHAEGLYSHAEGLYCHAEGYTTHAEGYGTHAEGAISHAEGYYGHAEGAYSHAEGLYGHAEGMYGHVEGAASHAEGMASHAEGAYSHAVELAESVRGMGGAPPPWGGAPVAGVSHSIAPTYTEGETPAATVACTLGMYRHDAVSVCRATVIASTGDLATAAAWMVEAVVAHNYTAGVPNPPRLVGAPIVTPLAVDPAASGWTITPTVGIAPDLNSVDRPVLTITVATGGTLITARAILERISSMPIGAAT